MAHSARCASVTSWALTELVKIPGDLPSNWPDPYDSGTFDKHWGCRLQQWLSSQYCIWRYPVFIAFPTSLLLFFVVEKIWIYHWRARFHLTSFNLLIIIDSALKWLALHIPFHVPWWSDDCPDSTLSVSWCLQRRHHAYAFRAAGENPSYLATQNVAPGQRSVAAPVAMAWSGWKHNP